MSKYLINAYDEKDWLYVLDDGTECVHQFTLPEGPLQKNEMSDTLYHAGDSAGYHEHERGVETFYVARGSVEVIIRGKRCIAEVGDMIHLMPHTPHGFVFLEEGTVWRELFQEIDMIGGTINKNHIKDNFPGLYESPEFRERYLNKLKNLRREPPVVKDVSKDQLHEIRPRDFAFSRYQFDGIDLKLKVGRWETHGVKEIWQATLRKGVRINWDTPYDETGLYFVAGGSVKFNVLGESFVAKADSIVKIPPYSTYSLEVLEDDTVVFDYNCASKLCALLEDYESIMQNDPERLASKEDLGAFMREYECYVTAYRAD